MLKLTLVLLAVVTIAIIPHSALAVTSSSISTSGISMPSGSSNCQTSSPSLYGQVISFPFINVYIPNTSQILCSTNPSGAIAPITVSEPGVSGDLSGTGQWIGIVKDSSGNLLSFYSDAVLYNPNDSNQKIIEVIQDSSGNKIGTIVDSHSSNLGQIAKYIDQHTTDFIGKYGSLTQIPSTDIPLLTTTTASPPASVKPTIVASTTTGAEQFWMPDPITKTTCTPFVPTGDSIKDSLRAMTKEDCEKSLQPRCTPDKNCVGSAGMTCDPSTGVADKVPNPSHLGIYSVIGCIPTDPPTLVNNMIKFSTSIAGGVALLLMAFGAIGMITSAGNEEAKKAAQQRFTSAIIGLMFIIFATLLLKIIGFDILKLPGFS